MNDRQVLDEQMAYYRARAGEYDEWFFREGRYDRGLEHRAQWFQEVSTVEAELKTAAPRGDVLELACGTGLWTRHLLETAERVTAVDASPETIAVNRERIRSDRVEYVVADIFSWTPPQRFDFALFTFWLSHVPSSRFDAFWAMLARAVRPGGRVFFVDSLLTQESTARDHATVDDSGIVRRKLNDGREFDIVKIFYGPTGLEPRLAALGWRGDVRSSGQFFVYGSVTHDGAAR